MAAKLTPWFPADVLPVRHGCYECRRKVYRGLLRPFRLTEFLRYDGEDWFYVRKSGLARAGDTAFMLPRDGDKWRGLAADPSKG